MPRKKIPILVLIAALMGALVFFIDGGDEDRELAQRLVRQQQARENWQSQSVPIAELADQARKLTPETVAKKLTRDSWTVESTQGHSATTRVVVPFDPALGVVESKPSNNGESHIATTTNPGFVGADSCAECHQERHRGFVDTAHFQTSMPLVPDAARGFAHSPKKSVQTADPRLSFIVDRSDQRVVQEVTLSDWSLKVPMDVVIGTAKIGQSFLYWHGDALYQTHLSYLSRTDGWIPSPGFADTEATYARPIRSGCLECHVTYIQTVKQPNHHYRDSAIWGISCERCHGPGRQHVQFHREHPQEKEPKHITYPRDLPRERQLDICGQCHSGGFSLLQNAFTFRPGDDLKQFHKHAEVDADEIGGIHTSNQLTRLQKSRCFQQSEMTCTTCHNPHKNQRGNIAVFTQRCLGCHEVDHCGMATKSRERIWIDCVSCHMPVSQNEDMTNIPAGNLQALMRDHYIRVDQAATRSYLAQ